MNIRQFAQLCGVSPSAVSRIMSRSQTEAQASAATYDRVRQMAREVGYKPNYAARTLHTQKSYCLGVIISFLNPVNAVAMINGISELANQHGYVMSITSCDNQKKLEAEAFESMLYRGVDAIIWHPTLQKGNYSTTHIEKVLAAHSKKPPIVCLSYNQMPGVFNFAANSSEAAVQAALRQLKLGCRKFSLLLPEHCLPMMRTSSQAFRETLLQHNVPKEHISEIIITQNSTDFSAMRGSDALWVAYLPLLHVTLKAIKKICDIKTLHIDGQSFSEDYGLTTALYDHVEGGFESLFASMQWQLLDGASMARRAVNIALQAMEDPSLAPFTEQLFWKVGAPKVSGKTYGFL